MRKWQLCQENQLQRKKREKKQFLKWEIHSQIFSLHVFACFLDVKETSLEVSENDTMFVCLFSPLYYQVNHKLEPRLWREKTQQIPRYLQLLPCSIYGPPFSFFSSSLPLSPSILSLLLLLFHLPLFLSLYPLFFSLFSFFFVCNPSSKYLQPGQLEAALSWAE